LFLDSSWVCSRD